MIWARVGSAAIRAAFLAAALVALAAVLRLLVEAPLMVPLIGMLAIAALVIAIVPLRRLPDEHGVAVHVDRTMGLHELFASSLSTAEAGDPASRSLRAMAADVASRMEASEVPIAAPSSRVAIAAALTLCAAVVTVSLSHALPSATAARIARDELGAGSERADGRSTLASPIATKAAGARDRTDDSMNAATESESANSAAAEVGRKPTAASAVRADDRGTAAGRTDDTARAELAFDAPRASPAPSSEDGAAGAAGRDPSAGGAASAQPAVTGGATDRRALSASPETVSAAARHAAETAITAGRVPARCRDLVSAYFDVSDAGASRRSGDRR